VEVAFLRFRVKLPMEDKADRAEDRLIGLLKSIDSANSFGNAWCKSADWRYWRGVGLPASERHMVAAGSDLPSGASRLAGGWLYDLRR
jgi:hypothetical protein